VAVVAAASLSQAGPAWGLRLTAAVGGVNNAINPYGSVYCNGDPSPVAVNGVITNSASCDGSTSFAESTDQLVLKDSSSSTYGWQSAGRASYSERFSFDGPGLHGTSGTLLITFAITGTRTLVDDDEPLDAVAEFGALTQESQGGATLESVSTTGFPLQLFGDATVPFLIHFEYGKSFYLYVSLAPGTYGRYGQTFASVDFSHTARIGSFEFRDQNGALVPDVGVTSQSGVNPFAPVPEPSPGTLMLGGMVAMAASRRIRG
jgi:hypothetical protein